jgi:Domain of unknown function (DUF4386)
MTRAIPVQEKPTVSSQRPLYLSAGILFIAMFIMLNVANSILAANFDFPDILRQPPENALTLYQQNQGLIRPAYYLFAFTGVLMIPISLLMHRILSTKNPILLTMATTFGVITGIVQVLGFIRWVFLAPFLVNTYFDPTSSQATKEAVLVLQEGFNRYAGVAVGEHLGWLFTGTWLVLLGIFVAQNRAKLLKPWMGYAVISWGLMILISSAEQFGYEPLFVEWSFIVGYGGFFTGLLILGIYLLFARPKEVINE